MNKPITMNEQNKVSLFLTENQNEFYKEIKTKKLDLEIPIKFSRGRTEVYKFVPSPTPTLTPTPEPTPESTPEPTPEPTPKPTPKVTIKQSDLELLSRIIYCESGAEPINGQMAVGQVILNRAKYYDMTIKEVIYQKNVNGIYVFSPVASHSYSSRKYNKESEKVATRLLSGEKYGPVGNALYFCTIKTYNKKGWHYQYVHGGGGVITLKTETTVYIH